MGKFSRKVKKHMVNINLDSVLEQGKKLSDIKNLNRSVAKRQKKIQKLQQQQQSYMPHLKSVHHESSYQELKEELLSNINSNHIDDQKIDNQTIDIIESVIEH